jgi:hypothetical protein
MHRIYTALLLALLPCAHAVAAAPSLNARIAPGLWELRYERHALVKVLGHDQVKRGTDRFCLSGDTRQAIQAWFAKQRCTFKKESLKGDTWHLEGTCKVKYQAKPLPMTVDFKLGDGGAFGFEARSPESRLIAYRERSAATRISPACPAK